MGASICCAEDEADTQFTIFDLSALKKQCLILYPFLIFACNWCSYAGADLAGTSRIQYPTNTRIVRTMCSGRVDPDFVKHAYNQGAGAVMLTGCRPQDCHYISGNDFALKRQKKIRRWMLKNGIAEERFLIAWMSAAEGKKFADTVDRMSEIARQVKKAAERAA